MTLINSLLSHATPNHWIELTSSLERLNTSRAVIRLMSSHTIEDLTNSILDYQGNMVRVAFFKKTRRVLVSGHFNGDEEGYENGYAGDGEQEAMLEYIWSYAKLEQDDGSRSPTSYLNGYGEQSAKSRGKGSTRDIVKWRKLGFETEDMRRAFEDTGMLGLECLVSYAAYPS
jgi:engulfment/cell motility protein 1